MIAGFIPPNDVIRYFELLMDEIHNNFNDECDDLIDYFEGTCIYFIQFINDTQDQCTSGSGNHVPQSPPPSPTSIQSKTAFKQII